MRGKERIAESGMKEEPRLPYRRVSDPPVENIHNNTNTLKTYTTSYLFLFIY